MGSDNKAVLISLDDLGIVERVAVQEAQLKILVDDFKELKHNIDRNIGEIFKLIRAMPDKIDTTIEKNCASAASLELFKSDIENKFDKSKAREKWVIGAIIAVTVSAQFIAYMWLTGLQISKLSGAG